MDKLLSIIIPSYNMEKYLPKCLGSLIVDDAALLSRLDVIVVNDGSKDRTSEIAHEFAAKYPGVFRVIDKPNGHYGSCINSALKVADGEFVKVLDADDWFDTVQFKSFISYLNENVGVDVVVSDVWITDGEGVVIKSSIGLPSDRVLSLCDLVGNPSWLSMHALTYRLQMLRDIDYHQTEGIAYTDGEWSALPMLSVSKARYFPNVLYMYLKGREGQSVDPNVQCNNFDKMLIVLEFIVKHGQTIVAGASDSRAAYLSKWLGHYLDMLCGFLVRMIPLSKVRCYWDQLASAFPLMTEGDKSFLSKYEVSRSVKFKYLHYVSRHEWTAVPILFLVRLCWRVQSIGMVRNLLKLFHG